MRIGLSGVRLPRAIPCPRHAKRKQGNKEKENKSMRHSSYDRGYSSQIKVFFQARLTPSRVHFKALLLILGLNLRKAGFPHTNGPTVEKRNVIPENYCKVAWP
jgi:hypothetical protein